jgi:hypothetical protein
MPAMVAFLALSSSAALIGTQVGSGIVLVSGGFPILQLVMRRTGLCAIHCIEPVQRHAKTSAFGLCSTATAGMKAHE